MRFVQATLLTVAVFGESAAIAAGPPLTLMTDYLAAHLPPGGRPR